MQVNFRVTLCLGRGDGGDVIVTTDVTDEEYKQLMENGGEVEPGDALYDWIRDLAIDENEACMRDYWDEDEEYEEIDYDDVDFMIHME